MSIAIPLFNEIEILPELLRRVFAVLDQIPGGPHELVVVDDGSTDDTLAALEEAARTEPRLKVVGLSRNFGHQPALTAAMDRVSGDVVVLMDGDLQDEPEAIPGFLERYQEGYDVVYAQRRTRKEPLWLKACYWTFYRLLSRMSNVSLPLDAGDFGLMSRRVVEQLQASPERHRYLRGLRAWAGFRQIGVPVDRAARTAGESKYGVWKLAKLGANGIFAFSIVPLRAAALVGAAAVSLAVLFSLYSVYAYFFMDRSPRGFTATIVVITFVSGVNLFFMGVIGEYVGRIYEEVKGRPLYVVGRTMNLDESGDSRPDIGPESLEGAGVRRRASGPSPG